MLFWHEIASESSRFKSHVDLLAPTGDRKPSVRTSAQSTRNGEPHQYGLMIECDGVLVDIHKDCHRVAFNKAFEVCLLLSDLLYNLICCYVSA